MSAECIFQGRTTCSRTSCGDWLYVFGIVNLYASVWGLLEYSLIWLLCPNTSWVDTVRRFCNFVAREKSRESSTTSIIICIGLVENPFDDVVIESFWWWRGRFPNSWVFHIECEREKEEWSQVSKIAKKQWCRPSSTLQVIIQTSFFHFQAKIRRY